MKTIFPIALIIVVGILGYVALSSDAAPTAGTSTTSSPTPAPGSEGVQEMVVEGRVRAYPASEVATHKTAESCWTIIRGNVYDLTEWVGKHPGGQSAIMQTCGIDATAIFENQHGGMEQQETTLAMFKMGVVLQ